MVENKKEPKEEGYARVQYKYLAKKITSMNLLKARLSEFGVGRRYGGKTEGRQQNALSKLKNRVMNSRI